MYDPVSGIIDFAYVWKRGHDTNVRVIGCPLKLWDNYNPDELYMLKCADDDEPTFHAAPGMYRISRFYETLDNYRKAHPVRSTHEWNESEHERTGGPNPYVDGFTDGYLAQQEDAPESGSIGVPLQEQVEDALGKALNVVEAYVTLEKDLRTELYQAQLDAQDWQNKYHQSVTDAGNGAGNLMARILELTDKNADLEVRNENQAEACDAWKSRSYQLDARIERQRKMIEVAKLALAGHDINGNSIV